MNKVDGRSLRKQNGANNGNAAFTWKQVNEMRAMIKKLPRYGYIKALSVKFQADRHVISRIVNNKSYLKRPPKNKPKTYESNGRINSLVSSWVGL